MQGPEVWLSLQVVQADALPNTAYFWNDRFLGLTIVEAAGVVSPRFPLVD